jgi:hypothetical protein
MGAGAITTITINGRIRSDRVFEVDELQNRACVTSSGNTLRQCATFGFSPTNGVNSGEIPLLFVALRWLAAIVALLVLGGICWRAIYRTLKQE